MRTDPTRRAPRRSSPLREASRNHSASLFAALATAEAGSSDHASAREQLVHLHLPLVEHCARRFHHRGEPLEDLVQVGAIGLLKAVDRFDASRGLEFSTYATPTIVGEIKRHFRDLGRTIRLPRRLQELRQQIGRVSPALTQALGRAPTPLELAGTLRCTVEEIDEALESAHTYTTVSLDAAEHGDDSTTILDAIGIEDDALATVEMRASIRPLLDALGPRERTILTLRFFQNMTQSEIATEIGISQMHVSRLLSRTLEQLRAALHAE